MRASPKPDQDEQTLYRPGEDGRLAITDAGSANGTWIGDDPGPITPGRTIPLADGDRIHVDSFTRITVRRLG
ncbi:FHA domain-containing protein [Frankia sp. AgPm24]|uniref:FHA domain-containing protein n=1 Tax=Frankia sp. AgPm24 TaxID=631128 RepID=UPI0035B1A69A